MAYSTATEKNILKLRSLLLELQYDKQASALVSLSRLRNSLKARGLTFKPVQKGSQNV